MDAWSDGGGGSSCHHKHTHTHTCKHTTAHWNISRHVLANDAKSATNPFSLAAMRNTSKQNSCARVRQRFGGG